MNYGSLQNYLIDWVHRDDVSSAVPKWVEMATAAFNRELRVPQMESRDSAVFTDEYSNLPADLLEIIRVDDSDGNEIRYMGRQEFAAYVAGRTGGADSEPVFTVEDMQIRLWPVPSVSEPRTVRILYFERIADLVDSADENWLLTEQPECYIYGSLVQARLWLQDDPRLPMVKSLYDEALAGLKRRRVVATGIRTLRVSDHPASLETFDITAG